MKTIGEAARFFLTRHWEGSAIGPYVVTTAEVRPGAFETTVSWGEDGPEVERFGSGLAFAPSDAVANHESICEQVEVEVGRSRIPTACPPAA